jgi:LacI family transcriptional regulator
MSIQPNSMSRRVALLVEASREYIRGLVRGVSRYTNEHREWSVYYVPQGFPPLTWFSRWQGNGILARIENQRMAEAILQTGLPTIDLRRAISNLKLPTMGPDDEAVARLAFDHLCERGFRSLGFFGFWSGVHPALDARCDNFQRLAREAGLACGTFRLHRRSVRNWDDELEPIIDWIRGLPKPVGVMTCNDDCGLHLLDICRQADVKVPEEVAVISVGNDDCQCNLAMPSLSSVDLDPERIGYEAAALLDRMMSGEPAPERHVTVEPRGICVRASTDVLATGDRDVILAVRFIRAHALEDIQVTDVLKYMKMSRGIIEPRVRDVLGHSIRQEIQRIRVERVKTLLQTTAIPLKQIATQTGFRYPAYMMRIFRQATGQTPTEYRLNAR